MMVASKKKLDIPICCIAYNRTQSLKRLLSSLLKADYTGYNPTLIISIDKSNTTDVEQLAEFFEWPYGEKIIYKHSVNLGLRKHVLECGNRISNYDGLVVLEDDIIVSSAFYHYAQQAVEFYKNDSNIAGISLYSFHINYQTQKPFIPLHGKSDVFFMKCAQSWGQVWIKERWIDFYKWYTDNHEEFAYDTNLPRAICSWPKTSWLKYHTRYCIETNKYFVYPYTSLSSNNSDAGSHVTEKFTLYQVPLLMSKYRSFIFEDFSDVDSVKYDGFFENEGLRHYFDYLPQLCIDLNGQKEINKFRYLLTTQSLPCKVIKSYDLTLRPIEMNIFMDQTGRGIYVYDTTERSEAPKQNVIEEQSYVWCIPSIFDLMRQIGPFALIVAFLKRHFIKK